MLPITKEFLLNELKTKTPTQIAEQVGCHSETIRRKIKNFQQDMELNKKMFSKALEYAN